MPTNVRATLALLVLALAAACGSSNAPPPETAPQRDPRTGQPTRTYYDTARRNTVIENNRPDLAARAGMLVIANQQGASATVLDAATLKPIATLAVGVGPHEVAVSPDGRWAVVTNYGNRDVQGNTLSVIDLAAPTPAVVRTIDLGEYHRPHGAAFVASGTKLLVTSESSQRLVMVDFASGRVDTALATNGRGSHMLTTQRDGRRAWTANMTDGTVTEFDIDRRRTVRTYPAAPMDEAIAATPGGVQVWVGSNSAHTVTILDATAGTKLTELTGFGMPYRIGISRTGRVAIVNDPVRNTIWLYEVGSNKELARLDVTKETGLGPITATPTAGIAATAGPEGVTFDPIADFAYITLHGTNQVVAVDLTSKKLAGFGSVGEGPDGIAYSPMVRRN
jgi:DNA-binding beta-propeller fold protein YncE